MQEYNDIEISKVKLGELIRKARNEKREKTGIKYTQKMLAEDIGVRSISTSFRQILIWPEQR